MSIWRSVGADPVQRRPLAVLDASSMQPEDIQIYVFHPEGLKPGQFDSETCSPVWPVETEPDVRAVPMPVHLAMLAPSSNHRWGYYSEMGPNEVLAGRLISLHFASHLELPI